VVICLFSRRRLGAYLDGALNAEASRVMTRHLEGCHRCRQEVDALRRLKGLLLQAMALPAAPDWTGFWPGIARGIQDGTTREVAVVRRRPWSPRWALSGAAVAAVVALSVVLWYERWLPAGPEESVVVTTANTQYPGGTMVYHTPGKVAVVWVFDE
jgi:anti-sigma factor RsiW